VTQSPEDTAPGRKLYWGTYRNSAERGQAVKYICWDEPGDDGGSVRQRITREEALKRMAHVKAKHPHANDEYLVADFITVHGAWIEEGQEP